MLEVTLGPQAPPGIAILVRERGEWGGWGEGGGEGGGGGPLHPPPHLPRMHKYTELSFTKRQM